MELFFPEIMGKKGKRFEITEIIYEDTAPFLGMHSTKETYQPYASIMNTAWTGEEDVVCIEHTGKYVRRTLQICGSPINVQEEAENITLDRLIITIS